MSELGSTSLPPRSPGAEPVTRIDRSQASADQQAPQQQSGQQAQAQTAPAADSGAHSHHDPAVSLAASFARIDRGAVLTALVAGTSPEGEPLLTSPSGTYVIENAGTSAKAALLKALLAARDVTLEIIATERVIEARILTIDGQRPPMTTAADSIIRLVLIKPPASDTAPQQAPTGTAPPPPTYGPPQQTAQAGPLPGPGTDSTGFDDPLTVLARPPQAPAAPPSNPVPPGPAPLTGPATSPGTGTGPGIPAPRVAMTPPTGAAAPQAALAAQMSAIPATSDSPPTLLGRPLPALLETATPRPAVVLLASVTPPPTAAAPQVQASLDQTSLTQSPQVQAPQIQGAQIQGSPQTAAPVLDGEILPAPASPQGPSPEAPPTRIATAAGVVTLAESLPLPPGTRVTLSLNVVDHLAPLDGVASPADLHDAFATAARPLMRALPATDPAAAPAIPPSALSAAMAEDAPLPQPHEDWASLSAAIATLTASDPALAAGILGKLPSPERLLTPVTLLFLTALGVRAPSRLLFGRDGVERLEAEGRSSLLARIDSEFAKLAALQGDRGDDWRPMLLPLRTENGPQAIPILIRQSHGDGHDSPQDGQNGDQTRGDGSSEGRVTRFILDLRLKATGQMQFDGMIRDRSFTLILRCERDLPPAAADRIRGLFRAALDSCGFSGDILLRGGAPVTSPIPASSPALWLGPAGPATTVTV